MGERLPLAAPGPFTVLSAELEVRAPLAGLGYRSGGSAMRYAFLNFSGKLGTANL